jgi:ABC-2 type transport system ATP-binding protein
MTPVVEVDRVVRRHGAVTAVDGLSFAVGAGEMFGLIGPDGSGKTTTLRLVLGLLRPDAGRVRTCGLDPWNAARRIADRVGYLSQRFSLYGDLTVDENVAFFAAVHGVRGWRARRDLLIEDLRLAPFRDRLADRLSGGMKQKLALACTLIHTPELLVLDEPTTGVDPVSRRDFWKILARLQRDGLTLLVTTPYLDEAERCQRVALLSGGRLLSLDAPAALRRQAEGQVVEIIAAPRSRAVEVLRAQSGVGDIQTFGERLHVSLPAAAHAAGSVDAERLAAALRSAGVTVQMARATEPSLEDIFIARLRAAGEEAGGRPVPPPGSAP